MIKKIIYVDIDNTICKTIASDYENSVPILENIAKINKLFEEGNTIIYWTARGNNSKIDWRELTFMQLSGWGCRFNKLEMGKPSYDLFICDKTKRIEEI
jgi:hypothetical protein